MPSLPSAWNTNEDTTMAIQNGGTNGAEAWNGGGEDRGRTPPNGAPAGGNGYRRSSRSRSPGQGRAAASGGGEERQPAQGGNPGNNLHVSGLSSRVDNRDLETAFAKYGKVAKAAVMYDPHTRDSRGFGFVTMDTAAEADAAIAGLNGTELKGRNLTVEKARRGRARTPTPGRYFGPPKRGDADYERPYDPRPYDSRYSERGYSRYDDRRYDDRGPPRGYGGGYDDRRYDDRRYDDRRGGDRRDYDRRYDRDYDRRY